MNQQGSKTFGMILLAIIALGLGYYGWYSYVGPGKTTEENKINDTSDELTNAESTSPVSEEKKTETPKENTTAAETTFKNTGFSFTFNYPSNWTLVSSTNQKMQETVKIKSDQDITFEFDSPSIATGFEEYTLNHAKDVSAQGFTFKRNYGQNSSGRTLYVATYSDPNNFDASSVSFYGIGNISETDIIVLDKLIASFKFN